MSFFILLGVDLHMERVISPEERMRRAEEIYYRRKSQGVRVSTSSVNIGKGNKVSLGKKMCIQIILCVIIYSGFWMIKGYNNVFSENVINHTKNILNYDINFQSLYNQVVEYFNNNFNSIIKMNNNQNSNEDSNKSENQNSGDNVENGMKNGEENTNENEQDSNAENGDVNSNNTESTVNNENSSEQQNENQGANVSETENNQNLGIGGGSDNVANTTENKTQMEIDAEYIKQNCNIIHPIEGVITSRFGDREPTEIISAFHQGIDIGAVTGTAIHAAMEGTVVAASYAGDYGNHIKIQNGEVLTVYAHCSELNVCVGDYVKQGQEIGKVGATGKVTGPHLHFELRRENRYVNPDMVLSF